MRQPPAARPAPSRLRPAGRALIVAPRIGGESAQRAQQRSPLRNTVRAHSRRLRADHARRARPVSRRAGHGAHDRKIRAQARRRRTWPREEWWRAFHIPELDGIVDTALRDNQSLRKAEDALRGADALVQVTAPGFCRRFRRPSACGSRAIRCTASWLPTIRRRADWRRPWPSSIRWR